MAAIVDLVPHTRIAGNEVSGSWVQPADTALDVVNHSEAAIMITVSEFANGSGTDGLKLFVETAMENRDERYITLCQLFELADDTTEAYQHFTYLIGGGHASSLAPSATGVIGLGRFLRIRAELGTTANDKAAFDAKVLLRP